MGVSMALFIRIDCSTFSEIPDWFNALKTVTEIQNGALIIENNTISEITVFPKLMTVENEQTSGENFMSFGEVTRSLFGRVAFEIEEGSRKLFVVGVKRWRYYTVHSNQRCVPISETFPVISVCSLISACQVTA